MYFDSHAHYNDKRFKDDMHLVIQSLNDKNVSYVANIGATVEESKVCVDLANQYDFIYASVGVHPHDVDNLKDDDIDTLRNLAKNKKVVAIGEIGMDLYYEKSKKDTQIYWFKKQLQLAKELDLPVVIHSRDADQLVFDIIKESNVRKGVIHCYSGSSELAKEYVKLGFYIGVGGVVTFKNASKLIKVVEEISIDNIVLETDLPYLAPVPHRGERNESSFLNHICDKVAELKNMSHNDVANITLNNALKLYEIK